MKKSIKFSDDNENNQDSQLQLQPNKSFVSFQNATCPESNHVSVEIRVVFLKLGNISVKDSRFSCEAFLEASWIDPNFTKSKQTLGEEFQFNDKIHWNPRIYLQNMTSNSSQEIWYHVEKQKHGHKISERRRLKGDFVQSFNLETFPFDLQELSLSISSFRSSKEVSLNLSKEKQSSVNVSAFTQTHEWILYPTVCNFENVKQGYFQDMNQKTLDVNVCVARKPTYYYWNSFLLNFIITLICYCCYSIKCDVSGNRMIIGITVLLTLITFKLSINKYLPSLSYLTIIDKYSLMNILIIFVNCTYFAIMGVLAPPNCGFPYNRADNYIFYVSISIFILLNIYHIVQICVLSFKNKNILEKRSKEYNANSFGKRTRIKSIFQNDTQYDANDE